MKDAKSNHAQRLKMLKRYFWNETSKVGVGGSDGVRSIPRGDLDALAKEHLSGSQALGFYAPGADGKTKWLVIDFDGAKSKANPLLDADGAAQKTLSDLRSAGFEGYLEKSKSGEGWHLWVFFSESIPCEFARKLGLLFAPGDAPLAEGKGFANPKANRGIEVFPKQFKLEKGKLGNFVFLPWWRGAPEGASQFYQNVWGELQPYEPNAFKQNSVDAVKKYVAANWKEETIEKCNKPTRRDPSAPTTGMAPAKPYRPPLPPDSKAVLEECGFVRYCGEKRKNLSEDDWYKLAGIFSCLPDGLALFQEYSHGYPGYFPSEAAEKFHHAKTAVNAPRTCQNISESFPGCTQCKHFGVVRNPVEIGITSTAARMVNEMQEASAADPGAPFERDSLTALSILKRSDPASYARARAALKDMNIPLTKLEEALKPFDRASVQANKEGTPSTQAALLVAISDEMAELFHTSNGDEYASVKVDGHKETYAIRSPQFRKWLIREYRQKARGEVPAPQGIQGALDSISAKATFDGSEAEVYLRVAKHGDKLYVDLCNPSWEMVEVDAEGWRMVKDAPVKFRREKGMLALPPPKRGSAEIVEKLQALLSIESKSDFRLLLAWLVNCFNPSGPYLALVLYAEQGSGKSMLVKLLRDLVDPNQSPLRREPRNTDDLLVSAKSNWIVAIDNMSFLPDWLSDDLCRLATGGGISKRAQYTNDEEFVLNAKRPLILNGIDEFVVRGDLASRAIILHLQNISAEKRKREEILWQEFEKMKPQILGLLFDALSMALRDKDTFEQDEQLRMADAWHWVTAAEPAIGWERGEIVEAYRRNQREANAVVLSSSALYPFLLELVTEKPEWDVTATELLTEINRRYENQAGSRFKEKGWPRTPKVLSDRIRRLSPALRESGIEVDFYKTKGANSERRIMLRK